MPIPGSGNVVAITVKTNNQTSSGLSAVEARFASFGKNIGKTLGGITAVLAGGIGGSGLLAMATPLAAAGVAVGAFGAVAIPVLTKVNDAQTKLTAAQLAYSKATTAAGRASALKAEQMATENLTGSQVKLMGVMQQIRGLWTQLGNRMSPLILAIAQMAEKLLRDLMPALNKLVPAGAKIIQAFLIPLDRLLSSRFFARFVDDMVRFGVAAANVVGPAVVQLLKVLMQLFMQLLPSGLVILKLLLPAFITLVQQLVPFIVLGAQLTAIVLKWLSANRLLIPALWALVAVLIATRVAALANPFTAIIGAVILLAFIIQRYRVQIINALVDIINFFFKLPGYIWKAISGLGSIMWNAGRNAVIGFWNGFVSMFSSFIRWLETNTIGRILRALGFLSPPKWAVDAGKQIVVGMQKGMTTGFGALPGLSTVAAPLAVRAGGQIAGAGGVMARGGGHNITINVAVSPGTHPRETGRAIAAALSPYLASGGQIGAGPRGKVKIG